MRSEKWEMSIALGAEGGDMSSETAAGRRQVVTRGRFVDAVVAVLVASAVLGGLGVACLVNDQTREWAKFHVYYGGYLAWKKQGGALQQSIYEPLMQDRWRDDMVRGLSYDQIVRKFPFLVDGDLFPLDSYKGEVLGFVRKKDPKAEILWFSREDDFDWCVWIVHSEATIELVKG